MARIAAALLSLVALLPGVGCDEAEPEEGSLVLATIDTHHFCNMDAVVLVSVRAHWRACPATEPDCDPPESIPEDTVVDGDRYTCPATDPHHDLGVRLRYPGRYRVEAVAELTTGEERLECFVDPESGSTGTTTGDTEIELPTERLVGPSPVVLAEHGPCPP